MKKIRILLVWLMILLLTGCGKNTAVQAPEEAVSEEAISETESIQEKEEVTAEERSESVLEKAAEQSAEESAEEREKGAAEAAEETEEDSQVPEEPQLLVVGEVTGTETEKCVALINNTPWVISGIEIITPDGEEWTGPMLTEGASFQPADSFILVFDPAAAAGMDEDYNVILTFADGQEHRLHGFPFLDTAEATINFTDVVFIEYFSASKNEIKSSYQNELAISWSKQGGGDDDPNAGCVTDGVFN